MMTLDINQHKTVLIRILKDIYTDSQIGPNLGFNGGTAVLLFYGLSRFSVDLDFDLLDSAKQELIFQHMQTILKKYGTVKLAQNKRYSLFFLLSYENKLKDHQNIKIEINKRTFGSRYEIKQYLGIPMKVMVQEDIAAHKLVAMHERIGKTNRDVYDVWFMFSQQWPINKEIILLRTGQHYIDFLGTCITDLESLNNRTILSGIGELLDNKQKIWVKTHLKNETVFLLSLAQQET